MLSLFCKECGDKTEYLASKPRFCGACGEPFDKKAVTAAASPAPVLKKGRRSHVVEEDDDYEEEIASGPRDYGLEAEVVGKPRVILIDDVIKEKKTGFGRAPGHGPVGDQMWAEMRQESARVRVDDGGAQ